MRVITPLPWLLKNTPKLASISQNALSALLYGTHFTLNDPISKDHILGKTFLSKTSTCYCLCFGIFHSYILMSKVNYSQTCLAVGHVHMFTPIWNYHLLRRSLFKLCVSSKCVLLTHRIFQISYTLLHSKRANGVLDG